MALTINTPIGTDRGLATNAYVRINEYITEEPYHIIVSR